MHSSMHRISTMKRSITICCCLILSFISSGLAFAQPQAPQVESATREVDRPFREEAEDIMKPAPKKGPEIEEEPEKKGPEGPKFMLKKVILTGTESFPAEEFAHIISKYEGKEVSLEDPNILAKEIEREYLRRGIIAACFLPPQDVKEGEVTLRVVEAKMGKLEIRQDGKFFNKNRLKDYWTVRPGEVLSYNEMSRSVQLMNKNPDRDVNATLHAGEKPGTTDVILTSKTFFPIHGFVTYDREGNVSTGRDRTGLGIKDNNFLFVDDTLLAGYTVGKDFNGIYAYHSVPITNIGTSIMYGFSRSTSAPKKEFTPFVIRSLSENYSAYVHQDLYNKAEYVGELSFGMDFNDKVTHASGSVTNKDRLRIFRIKPMLIHRFPGAITYITPQFSQGLNIFGARSKNQFSSRGADSTFSKFNLSIQHKRALPLDLQASWNLKAQFASEKLTPQEEFSIGGIDSVRGYPSGDYQADNAVVSNFELLIPSFFIPENWKIPYDSQPLKDAVTGVLFCDYGYGMRRAPVQSEEEDVNDVGIGAGVRIRLFNQALVRLEWGFPVGDKGISEVSDSRFHFSVNFDDQFNREFIRMKDLMQEEEIKKVAWRVLNSELEKSDSPLGNKLYSFLNMAQVSQKNGDLAASKTYYAKFLRASNSLYSQAESYVKSCIAQKTELKEYAREAQEYYDKGDVDAAKALWEKIETEASIKPLVLEI